MAVEAAAVPLDQHHHRHVPAARAAGAVGEHVQLGEHPQRGDRDQYRDQHHGGPYPRQGDVQEAAQRARAVDGGGLVQLPADVGQRRQVDDHVVAEALPGGQGDRAEQQQPAVGEEGDRRVGEAGLPQHAVDQPPVVQGPAPDQGDHDGGGDDGGVEGGAEEGDAGQSALDQQGQQQRQHGEQWQADQEVDHGVEQGVGQLFVAEGTLVVVEAGEPPAAQWLGVGERQDHRVGGGPEVEDGQPDQCGPGEQPGGEPAPVGHAVPSWGGGRGSFPVGGGSPGAGPPPTGARAVSP